MTRPLVSYVVTLYNKAPFLPYLCAGIAAQDGPFDKEVILVDDGSTDDSAARAAALTADWPRVRLIRQANAGPAAALNAGFAAATGSVIKPVDGDDMLTPWATRTLLRALERSGAAVASAEMDRVGRYDLGAPPPFDPAAAGWGGMEVDAGAWRLEPDPLRASLRCARTTPSSWLALMERVRACGGCDPGLFIQDYSIELRLAAQPGGRAMVETMGFWAPEARDGRLSNNQAQTLHDCNAAVLRFLRDHPELSPALRRFGLKRAAGRAWAWARRHGGARLWPRAALDHVLAQLGALPLTDAAAARLCGPFRATHAIRRPFSDVAP